MVPAPQPATPQSQSHSPVQAQQSQSLPPSTSTSQPQRTNSFTAQRYSHLDLPSQWNGWKVQSGEVEVESEEGVRNGNRLTDYSSSNRKSSNTFKLSNYHFSIGADQQWPIEGGGGGGEDGPTMPPPNKPPVYRRPTPADDTLALILPLLILLSTLLFMLLLFVILVLIVRRRSRISLSNSEGPIDVGREADLESSSSSSNGNGGLGGISGIEERWLETQPEGIRIGYARSKDWSLSNPPGSISTEITMTQYLTIQEKGLALGVLNLTMNPIQAFSLKVELRSRF